MAQLEEAQARAAQSEAERQQLAHRLALDVPAAQTEGARRAAEAAALRFQERQRQHAAVWQPRS